MSSIYRVHQFESTSLKTAQCFANARAQLTGVHEIIIVSAIPGATPLLHTVLTENVNSETSTATLETLKTLHRTFIMDLLPPAEAERLLALIEQDLNEIKRLLHAIKFTGSYAKEIQDRILGFGERWAAQMLMAYLEGTARTIYLEASTVLAMETGEKSTAAVNWGKSKKKLQEFIVAHPFDQLIIANSIPNSFANKKTMPEDLTGNFSAAIFARLFDAQQLFIWTDVDGIYSADPRKVPAAFPLLALSYEEASELAYFGAPIIHPQMIAPAIEGHIPIYIKNIYNPNALGTCISDNPSPSAFPIRGISSINDIALINIEGTGLIGVSGTAARVFQTLQKATISVILISQASSEHSICFAISQNDADHAVATLMEHFSHEITTQKIERIHADKACAILAIVGDGMVGTPGVAAQLCQTLAQANINIRAIAQGSSERNISIVIERNEIDRALRAVHGGFYLSNRTIAIGLVGPGHIGKTLLKQIEDNIERLKKDYQVTLCIRGIMNSKTMLLGDEDIALSDWQTQLNHHGVSADLSALAIHLRADGMPHAVIIDCTASKEIAGYYVQWMEQGIHVITPNKQANAGNIDYYHQLRQLTLHKNKYYLYETTVCAGLPVINTLQDLIKTGDTIIKIEGIVSGTLSYIFSALATGESFSKVVKQAKMLGYTEPDPRDDLSGIDVARKMVCLARELGMPINLEDIAVESLVPDTLRSCSVDDFLNQLSEYDASLAHRIDHSRAKGEKLAYVGSIEPNKAVSVTIGSYPENHPFSRLQGTDNMLIFHTARYHEQPLVIQGPGAGADVTAAGIFADLLRLVSFLSA